MIQVLCSPQKKSVFLHVRHNYIRGEQCGGVRRRERKQRDKERRTEEHPFFSLPPSLTHLLVTHHFSKSRLVNAHQRRGAGLVNDMQNVEEVTSALSSKILLYNEHFNCSWSFSRSASFLFPNPHGENATIMDLNHN